MSSHELGIIGGGNMAEAIVRGVLEGGLLAADRIVVSEPDARRRELFAGFGVAAVEDNLVPARCPKLLLAVKPQVMPAVLGQIAPTIPNDCVVISIAAGVTMAFLDSQLGGRGRIIRVMPNTPMLAGAGMSALSSGPRAKRDDLVWAQGLFAASGETCVVDERHMDAVTAVSGSGPAYFFYLIEAMIAAGVAEGLPADIAAKLAVQTCAGSAALLLDTAAGPAELRAKVTSPNGTTQRAIETLDAAGAKELLVKAVRAAAQRSRELGK